MAAIDLSAAPFHLEDGAQAWVQETLTSLSPRDKLAQLFILLSRDAPEAALDSLRAFKPAGITRIYSSNLSAEIGLINDANSVGPVPMLVSADLEGSRMSLPFGTEVPNPLALAAIDDVETTSAIATIMAEEAHAVGLNWSFTPLLDINAAWRSAIVSTRSFGSDVDLIERHALAEISAFQASGVAATVKHWPGEGFDDRDQHLVTTVNPLSVEEWEDKFGRLYRAAIDAGVMSVMSAHIAFPAYVLANDPDAGAEAYRPAVLSSLLNQHLLREKLGFNGLIVTDATPMAGFGDWGPRSEIIPQSIIAGCDLILFSDDPTADLMHLVAAVADGRLSQERVDEAVTRVLALKAALGLHKTDREPLEPISAQLTLARLSSKEVAKAAHDKVPTLVKDTANLLPLTVEKHKRVLIFSTGAVQPFAPVPLPLSLPDLLREQGFEITEYTPDMQVNIKDFDLVLYLLAEETLLTRQRIFLNWRELTGNVFGAMKRYWHDVPVLMVSLGYPFYLHDAPRVKTYVNAYASNEDMQQAVLDCLLGKKPFLGKSPVDPFCGSDQAKY
ncbi:glycoside hydrolase family 3 N-terminal domain-containing protein [Devosia sp. MC521]|uniref:glycoside hydrolase family 3 protein n=1 Tax=Devosia sp. MC521 TaxID=2759954 RepID=UPI0015FE3E28|nr:glycoside hydrolase family 3 N-terminal domain-containing protein [Devosia sp. MC521]MBJ6987108.1 glycoside hydrolase family 3 protein [Devosia sp. MC521]QMW62727.1 glycoside hydrolase family 3 protein [Devosia sp. MC521]